MANADIDQVLGFNNAAGSRNTATFNTLVATAANVRICASIVCWDNGTAPTPSVTVGGSAATLDAGPGTNPMQRMWFFSIWRATVLPLGSAITVTLTGSVDALAIYAESYSGVLDTNPYVETSGFVSGTGDTPWTSGSLALSNTDGNLLRGHACGDGMPANASSNETFPTVEAQDQINNTTTQASTTVFRIITTPGSYTVSGAWTAAGGQDLIGAVAYKAAAGGAGPVAPTPIITMPARMRAGYRAVG